MSILTHRELAQLVADRDLESQGYWQCHECQDYFHPMDEPIIVDRVKVCPECHKELIMLNPDMEEQ